LEPGINLTPLLDAIFNLVFFFLLATTLRREEVEARVQLPPAESGLSRPAPMPELTVDAHETIYLNGVTIADEEKLEAELAQLASEGVREIAIRGDETVRYGLIRRLMDLCGRAGLDALYLTGVKP